MIDFFAKFRKKNLLSFDNEGVDVFRVDSETIHVKWRDITKIVFLDSFEEYSGYFLTEEYKSKLLYHSISINCNQNVVKVRTGGNPTVKKNTSKPFAKKFGITNISKTIFVEYLVSGNKQLYAVHFKEKNKEEIIKQLNEFIPNDKIHLKKKIEGFNPLSEL